MAWCPTRTGLLATLTRDSNVIRLYDMQHTPTPIGDETEPTVIERSVRPCDSQLGSFAWHPSAQNRMVVVSAANRVMTDFTVFERISLAWSSSADLTWACGRHLYDCTEDGAGEGAESAIEKDIATKMRQRAQSRYGHDTTQVWRNHLLAGGDDAQLKSLWYDLFYILWRPEAGNATPSATSCYAERCFLSRCVLFWESTNDMAESFGKCFLLLFFFFYVYHCIIV